MKRFQFQLEKLLSFRRQLQRQAELRQQKVHSDLVAAQTVAEAMQQQLSRSADALDVPPGQATSADLRALGFQHLLRVQDSLQAADGEVSTARRNLDEADRLRAAATTDAEVLKHLRDNRQREHRRAGVRSDQARSDDVALRRWHDAAADGPHPNEGNAP